MTLDKSQKQIDIDRIYRETIENAMGIPYRLNLLTKEYEFFGAGTEDLLGIKMEELDYDVFSEHVSQVIITDQEWIGSKDEYKGAFSQGKVPKYKADICFMRPDGQEVWLSDNSVPILDNNKNVIGALGIIQDITKRKKEELEQEALAELTRQLTAPLTLRDVALRLVEVYRELFDFDSVYFGLYCEPRKYFDGVYAEDTAEGEDATHEIPLEDLGRYPVTPESMVLRAPQLINRTEEEIKTAYHRFGNEERLSRSIMVAAVTWEEKKMAFVTVQSYTPNRYNESDLRMCVNLANQCGGALERLRVEREREALQRLSYHLTKPMTLKEIGVTTAREAYKVFEYDAFLLDVLNSTTGNFTGVYYEDTPVGGERPVEVEPLDENPPRSLKMHSLVNRTDNDSDFERYKPVGFVQRRSLSLMFAPIYWHGRIIGILSVQSYMQNQYTDRDVSLLQSFANQLSGALLRSETERLLRLSEERYALVLRGANDGMWDWDLAAGRIYYSDRWRDMLDLKPEDIGDDPDDWFQRVHPSDKARLQTKIDSHLKGDSSHFECEHRVMSKGGEYRWMLSRGIAVKDDDGHVTRFAGSQTDITMRKKAEDLLIHDASHDALTGLPNRNLFLDRLKRSMALASRHKDYKFAVLFLDLDRFKVVNDAMGHMAGDELLKMIAQRLAGCLRPGDTVARFGGDEFTILLEEISEVEMVTTAADRILGDLAKPFVLNDKEIFVTASIGIALSTTHYNHPEDLLRDADTVMYRAKMEGKARYAIFDVTMRESAVETLELESDLRRAIQRKEFELYYQPIIDIATGKIAGLEALLRWRHFERGYFLPEQFLPLAHETGLMSAIEGWVFNEACRQIKEWIDSKSIVESLWVSVNIHKSPGSNFDLAEQIKQVLAEHSLGGEHLKIELTESGFMDLAASTVDAFNRVRDLGVEVFLDDFGTGYSSLSYLERLPVDLLKIDKHFVSRLDVEREKILIVRTVLALAHSMKKRVIAEGVETQEQLNRLKDLQCQFGQGYFFSRPLPVVEAKEFLEQN